MRRLFCEKPCTRRSILKKLGLREYRVGIQSFLSPKRMIQKSKECWHIYKHVSQMLGKRAIKLTFTNRCVT